jgi:elongation factor 1-beta
LNVQTAEKLKLFAVKAAKIWEININVLNANLWDRDYLSEVKVTFKVMPESGDTDISKVENAIKSRMEVQSIEKEPIAFGLVALKVVTALMDAEGVVDKIEEELRAIPGVGEVEVAEISRFL